VRSTTASPSTLANLTCCTQPTTSCSRYGAPPGCQSAIGRRGALRELFPPRRAHFCSIGTAGERGRWRKLRDAKHAGACPLGTMRWSWILTTYAVCSSRPNGQAQGRHRQSGRQVQGEGRGTPQIRPIPHVLYTQIRTAVCNVLQPNPAPANQPLGSQSGRMN
jgi:hypothetical protein